MDNNNNSINNNGSGFYGAPVAPSAMYGGNAFSAQGAAAVSAMPAYGAAGAPRPDGTWSGGIPGVPPPYGATAQAPPRYGGPGAYYGTYAPAAAPVVGGVYTPPAYGGTVVSPTRPPPVVAPTAPPRRGNGGQPPVAPMPTPTPSPTPTPPPMPTPTPLVPSAGRQRPTRLSVINRTATIIECQWHASTGATGSFRIPQSHAHMFAAPAPLDAIRIYAVASDGPLGDILYEGPRDPAPGVPPLGPVLGLLAAGCGVFETMLDFYLGTASGTNGTNDVLQPPLQPPPQRPPTNMPAAPQRPARTHTPASSTVGAFGTWRATDIAAAWVRACHGNHCLGP
ncbi:hypothetical protein pneo_cds_872 [Pandoravirus neocaledonia]|uniref:Uncharacterized protein n=1 Tax=Pandoravirus neocaledonia TaxID=2107708 RepID=A0A2U7UDD4_9VIRU|nr:hypothetical protein pneo_cds_872 [Pandoravirus neocaledonia]AVK76479.1 hypothetical protein pneo_cds_872 [Pandoravirus neocaledonia]